MNVLLLKINIHPQRFEHTDSLKERHSISRKAGDGFCEYQINFSISAIFQHLLKKYSSRFGKDVGGCTEGARQRLREHPFEGNVRELSNLAERLCVMVEGNVIDEDLMLQALYPEDVRERERKAAEDTKNRDRQKSEAEEITEALRLSGGKKADAARMLNMDRTTLWRKIKQYGLND